MSATADETASAAFLPSSDLVGLSRGRGFFASTALNPGGGNDGPPPGWVEVSVAYCREGRRIASAEEFECALLRLCRNMVELASR